jgi:hypothetical protein
MSANHIESSHRHSRHLKELNSLSNDLVGVAVSSMEHDYVIPQRQLGILLFVLADRIVASTSEREIVIRNRDEV